MKFPNLHNLNSLARDDWQWSGLKRHDEDIIDRYSDHVGMSVR